ncbi:MAG: T9SS type A sorting domain-containing protein [Prevotella sp.]|nr:T9SS type A sorting domain-containing protein [Prevotella sp.]
MINKKLRSLIVGTIVVCCLPTIAQDVKIKGVAQMNRYDDGEQMNLKYIAWNSNLQKGISISDYGVWAMNWNGTTLGAPVKEPDYPLSSFYSGGQFTDDAKANLVNNQLMMVGNSGAVYVNGTITTVFSRDEQSTVDDELFRVCQWNAETGEMLSNEIYPKSACLESAGMAYNPIDGKVYGLFYLTEQKLSSEFTDDPDFFTDQDGEASDEDAGYCICTIDLNTMKITPITPGLYYYNFVTFAINSEGRAFALTSGGTSGSFVDADGRLVDINGNLSGAQLCEFNLQTGLMVQNAIPATDPDTGEEYTEYEHPVGATGVASQYKRQSACFDKNNPNKMYWNGYVNSGKGINDWGSWSTLSDKEWRTNGKFDTALYEVDITTGVATRLSTIKNRFSFSCLWVDGADASDELTGIHHIEDSMSFSGNLQVFNTSGQLVYSGSQNALNLQPGIYIIKNGTKVQKVMIK